MKLKAVVSGESHEVQLARDGDNVVARVDDRTYQLAASEPEPGVFLLKDGQHIYEAAVTRTADGKALVRIRNTELEVAITDPKRLRGSAASRGHEHGHAEIKTAMPGKVVRILKTAGDTVAKGEGVIVVEAMKMQNEMKSPRDGTIGEIRVAEGETVGAGDVLVMID